MEVTQNFIFIGSSGQVFYGLFRRETDQIDMEVAIKTIKGKPLC